jgi:hypothetical protein
MLSRFGEDQAIPLARQMGKTFFTVKLYYRQDRALFEQLCPANSARCDCVYQSLYGWKFANGRQFSRSEWGHLGCRLTAIKYSPPQPRPQTTNAIKFSSPFGWRK